MMRKFVCAAVALVLCVGVVLADEIKGKIKSVDADKSTMTVTTSDGKDHVVQVGKDTRLLNAKGNALKEGIKDKHLKDGSDVVVQCEKKDGKAVASEVKLVGKKNK
jgi:outer membrane lipoprotein-sorting protein